MSLSAAIRSNKDSSRASSSATSDTSESVIVSDSWPRLPYYVDEPVSVSHSSSSSLGPGCCALSSSSSTSSSWTIVAVGDWDY